MQGILAGRYRLDRQLGKGGMGSVWLAEHLALRSWVAVKLMDPAIAATPEGAERFRREAQAAASLRSTHVVQVLDYGVHENTPFLVMELLHGESLAGCLEREKRLTPERTLTIITQVARALGRAHSADIVHRDLKPDNIFLVKEDDQELVKILDFGIAKTPSSTFGGMETRTGVTMGTPYYMSPEQVEGKRAVDFRTDLWAMAVITSECMTGVRPFDGSTFGELLLNICARPIAPPSSQGFLLPGFDAWFAKAANRDSEQRFSSAQELAATLGGVVRGAGLQGYPTHASVAAVPPPPPPANVLGQAPYTHGASPAGPSGSGPSLNTAQAHELATRGTGRSALPWLLLAAVVALSAAGAAVLLLRSPADSPDPDASRSAAAAHASPVPSPPVTLAPAPESAPTAREAQEGKPNARPAGPTPLAAKPAPASEATATPATTSPSTPPAPASTTTAAAKTSRCFSDPFSGQVRPAGTTKPAAAATFACKQDPFTGKYKKL